MRLSFVPHLFVRDSRPYPYVPLGLISLATIARQLRWHTSFVDPNRMADYSPGAIADAIAAQEPDVVGLGSICGAYPETLRYAQAIKEHLPGSLLILGGPQASATATETLSEVAAVDYILRGEAELSFPRFLAMIVEGGARCDGLGSVPGLVYRRQGEIVVTPSSDLIRDLDSLPRPDYSLYPYWNECPSVPVEVGRGCPYGCTYCATTRYWRRRFRLFSVNRVVDQIAALASEGGDRFDLVHDIFTLRRDWVEAFCDALLARVPGIAWDASTRLDALDEELIERMRQSGCRSLFFGIETGSERMQTRMGKRLNLGRAREALSSARRSGIETTASFILGFPDERGSDMKATVQMVFDLAIGPNRPYIIQVHLLAPLAESMLFEHLGGSVRYFGREVVQSFATTIDDETEAWVQANPRMFASFHGYPHPLYGRRFLLRLVMFLRAVQCLPIALFSLLGYGAISLEDVIFNDGNILEPMDRVDDPDDIGKMADAAAEVLGHAVTEIGDECAWIVDLISFETALCKITACKEEVCEPMVITCSFDCTSFIERVTDSVKGDATRWYLPQPPIDEVPITLLIWRENGATRTLALPPALAAMLAKASEG